MSAGTCLRTGCRPTRRRRCRLRRPPRRPSSSRPSPVQTGGNRAPPPAASRLVFRAAAVAGRVYIHGRPDPPIYRRRWLSASLSAGGRPWRCCGRGGRGSPGTGRACRRMRTERTSPPSPLCDRSRPLNDRCTTLGATNHGRELLRLACRWLYIP